MMIIIRFGTSVSFGDGGFSVWPSWEAKYP